MCIPCSVSQGIGRFGGGQADPDGFTEGFTLGPQREERHFVWQFNPKFRQLCHSGCEYALKGIGPSGIEYLDIET